MEKKIHYRKASQIGCSDIDGLFDSVGGALVWNEKTRTVFQSNPFSDDPDAVVQVIGSVDGTVAATSSSLPLDVYVGDRVYRTAAGHDMRVNEEFRNTQFGLKLPMERLKSTPNNFYISAAQSQMMIKVQQFLKCTIFYMPRLIMLFKSRAVVETKISGVLGRCITALIDIALSCYWLCLRMYSSIKLRGCIIERVEDDNEAALKEIADIIKSDKHLCGEVHDERWLKWLLTNSFDDAPANELLLVRKDTKAVAFVMSNHRFFKQASHRGFKDVWLSTLLEWGSMPGFESILKATLLKVAADYRKQCDAIQVLGTDATIEHFFRGKMWRQVGDGHFVIKIGKGSPLEGNEEFLKQENWRLRPAMGDAGFI